MSSEILNAQRLSKSGRWTVETDEQLLNGISVLDHADIIIGGILAIYPKKELVDAEQKIIKRVSVAAGSIWVFFSLLTLLVSRIRLAGAIEGTRILETWLDTAETKREPPLPEKHGHGLLGDVMLDLHNNLLLADEKFHRLANQMGVTATKETASTNVAEALGPKSHITMASLPETSLARAFAHHLAPWNIAIILLAVMSLACMSK